MTKGRLRLNPWYMRSYRRWTPVLELERRRRIRIQMPLIKQMMMVTRKLFKIGGK